MRRTLPSQWAGSCAEPSILLSGRRRNSNDVDLAEGVCPDARFPQTVIEKTSESTCDLSRKDMAPHLPMSCIQTEGATADGQSDSKSLRANYLVSLPQSISGALYCTRGKRDSVSWGYGHLTLLPTESSSVLNRPGRVKQSQTGLA